MATLIFIFGLLGNIISFMVFLAPMPTFYTIIKTKSTQGFHCLPYLASLFSCLLWVYYAFLKTNSFLLITINSIGSIIEIVYITIYIAYAPKKSKILTMQLLLVVFGGFALVALLTLFYTKGSFRLAVLGWICLVFSISVFAAPLSIITRVIRTKSVEFMPFSLSFFLTLNAIMWLFYGLLQKDFYIAFPNIIGLVFGVLQMVLYIIYKNKKQVMITEQKLHPLCSLPKSDEKKEGNDQNLPNPEKTNLSEISTASSQV